MYAPTLAGERLLLDLRVRAHDLIVAMHGSNFCTRFHRVLAFAACCAAASVSSAQLAWTDADIGAVSAAGSSSVFNGVYSVNGSGADIWDSADEFHFRYLPITGDGVFIVRVSDISYTHSWAKAGIMIRSDLSASAAHVFACVNPDRIASRIYRPTAGAPSQIDARLADVDKSIPMWLKLTRDGSTIATHFSKDGVNWTLIASGTFSFPSTVYVGLAVTSHVDGTLCTATIDNVSFSGLAPGPLSAIAHAPARIDLSWQNTTPNATGHEIERSLNGTNFAVVGTTSATTLSFSDTTVSPATTYYYRVRATSSSGPSGYSNLTSTTTPPPSPAGWTSLDVGNTALTGRATESGGVVRLDGAGAGVGGISFHHESTQKGDLSYTVPGYSDEFQYCYKPWSGDGEIIGRLDAWTGPAGAQAGILIRAGAGESALSLFLHQRGGSPGIALLARAGTTSVDTRLQNESHIYYETTTGGPWFKLVRSGTGVMAYASTDGAAWAELGWVSATLPANIQMGLGVSSTVDGNASTGALPAMASGSFSNIRIGAITTPVGPPPAPTGLAVNSMSLDTVYLSWQNPANGFDFVEVERSTDGGAFTKISYAGFKGSQYADSGAPGGYTYQYRVRVTRSTTYSPYSNVVMASPSTAPNPPSSLAAQATTATQVVLTWQDNSTSETGFHIYRSVNGGAFGWLDGAGANVTKYTDSSASPSTTYTYRVRAAYSTSSYTAFSNDASATTPALSPTGPVWQELDIGSVAAAGSTTVNGGMVTVRGSGRDIWNTADAFHYRFQPWSGYVEITARVIGLQNTNPWAKCGVMVRESLAPGSRHMWMCTSAEHGTGFQGRPVTDGECIHNPGTLSGQLPVWVRVVRNGNMLSGYESPDGVTWTLVGTQQIALPEAVYVGLAVTSHNDGVLCDATFDSVTVTGTASPPPPAGTVAAPSELLSNAQSSNVIFLQWRDNSTDETGFELERSADGTSYSLLAMLAANTVSYSDQAVAPASSYYYRVRAVRGTDRSGYSNTLVAYTTTPWTSGDIGAVGAAGTTSGSGASVTLQGSGADIWDASDEFRYYYESWSGLAEVVVRVASLTNTSAWAKAGIMFRETTAANSRHVFLCVTPGNGVALQYRSATGGQTSHIAGTWSTAPRWLRLRRNASTFTADESADGVAWQSVGTVTVDMANSIFVGLAVTSHNDGALATAQFDNLAVGGNAPPPSSTPAPANLAGAAVSPTDVNLTWSDPSNAEIGFTVEMSTNNVTYQAVGFPAANATSAQVGGLSPATTHYFRIKARYSTADSSYSNVVTVATPSTTPPPAATWQHADVGNVGLAGSDDASDASITVRGSGADIWDGADGFRFVYKVISGNVTVDAQVSSITNTDAWAKAGVMIRESLAPGARNVFAMVTAGNGVGAQARTTAGGSTSFTPGPWGAAAPYWVRLVRTSDTIVASVSRDGTNWQPVATYTVAMGAEVYVGFAVTAHNNATLNTAVFSEPFIQ